MHFNLKEELKNAEIFTFLSISSETVLFLEKKLRFEKSFLIKIYFLIYFISAQKFLQFLNKI